MRHRDDFSGSRAGPGERGGAGEDMGDSPGGSGVAWVVVTVVQAPEASDAVTVVVMVGMLKRLKVINAVAQQK